MEVGGIGGDGGHGQHAGAFKGEGVDEDEEGGGDGVGEGGEGGGDGFGHGLEELDGDDDLEAGVGDDGGEFGGLEEVIQGQGDAAVPAGGAEGDDEGGGGRDEEADFVAELGGGGEGTQVIDHEGGAVDEFAVGEGAFVVDDGDGVGVGDGVSDDLFEDHKGPSVLGGRGWRDGGGRFVRTWPVGVFAGLYYCSGRRGQGGECNRREPIGQGRRVNWLNG